MKVSNPTKQTLVLRVLSELGITACATDSRTIEIDRTSLFQAWPQSGEAEMADQTMGLIRLETGLGRKDIDWGLRGDNTIYLHTQT